MTALAPRVRTAARPGPGPTPEALLRALDLSIGRRIRGLVAGEFRARDLGGGTELAQVRPYEPGDDVRRIDWNATARMIVPHVRVHVPERALTSWLLLDVSPSMAFGTADRRKTDVAEGVAIAVGHLSTQRGNRLGVLTFGGRTDRQSRPMAGRAGLLATLGAVELEADGREGGFKSPEAALRFVAHGAPAGGLVVLVSDLRGPLDWLPQLGAVAQRHSVLVVEVRDPREDALPDVGELNLIDAETGRTVRVDTSSTTLRTRFAEAAARDRDHVARELRRAPRPPRRPVHVRQLAPLARRPAPPPGNGVMTFASPELLLVLLLVPIFLALYLLVQRRRAKYVVRFTNVDLLTNLVPKAPRWRRHVPTAFYLAAIAALAIALAKPSAVLNVPREEATVMLAMDVSRSMIATDVSPTRLDAAKQAAETFVKQLPAGFRVGLVAFSTDARLVVAPTTDRAPGPAGARQPPGRRRHRARRRDRRVAPGHRRCPHGLHRHRNARPVGFAVGGPVHHAVG